MWKSYVISDNIFFNIGLSFAKSNTYFHSVTPEEIMSGSVKPEKGVVYIYIHDIRKLREVCFFLESTKCDLVFFFDFKKHMDFINLFGLSIWNAKIKIRTLTRYMSKYEYKRRNAQLFIKANKKERLMMMARGIDYFQYYAGLMSENKKTVHSFFRSFLSDFGMSKVSLHNLLLSEKMSIAYMAAYNIKFNIDVDNSIVGCTQKS